MGEQKSLTDIVADAKIGLIQKSFDGIDSALSRIIPHLHGIGDLLRQIAADLLKLEAMKLFRKLLGLEQSSESNGESGGSSGGIFGTLRGLFSGGNGGGGLFIGSQGSGIFNFGGAGGGGG